MEPSLGLAIKVAVVGLVVLLIVLAALAGIVYLLTRFIVDKKEEEAVVEETPAPVAAVEEPKTDLSLAAVVAVAIARAQAEIQNVTSDISAGEVNAWRQFGLQRRLNQTSTIRRTR